jgi:hypothetical protein
MPVILEHQDWPVWLGEAAALATSPMELHERDEGR